MHAKTKKTPENLVLKTTYIRYRNYCNTLLRKLKIAYETNELLKAKKNPKELWKVIKDITHTRKTRDNPSELLNLCENPQSSVNKISSYFSHIGETLASKITATNHSNQSLTSRSTNSPPANSMGFLPIDESEVESQILQLRSNCAIGWDGIPSTILKKCRETLVPPITYAFNLCLQRGVFPNALKKAIVYPIFKKGDRNCISNYRPISVLSAISKILEKILNKQLRCFLDKNRVIADNQYGFRSGVSTEDAVLDLTEFVARSLDRQTKCLGIFLDLTKAFDTVSVPKLINKLERVGVRGVTLDLFRDYLTHRTQCVKLEKYLSEEQYTLYGVPQGSVLGPTLFQIYINDLCKLTLKRCKIYAYADDTAIIVYGSNWRDIKINAESALNHVMSWLNHNLLTLNLTKTVYIPFALRHTTKPPDTFTLTAHSCADTIGPCSCTPLTKTDTVRYLGVLIDDSLKWDKQINALINRTLRLIGTLRSLRDSANWETLKMVYLALCQSVTGYCITVWGGTHKTLLLGLERAQRAILKVMSKKPLRYPTSQLYTDCKVLSVRQLFVLQSILRQHSGLPHPNPEKRRNVPLSVRHRTAFAKHHFYVLGAHIYKKNTQRIKNTRFK
ncbi:unnamed protein product [Arctia plantaginis]|uniref:Reverse transcriptase domain-containing protein n=1 Tax=Arctia plantaginis TaxID=874455 RepID=A0A8S0Z734_ARCPL|nr:unnamed protein product [Arctia plantaginis]